MKIPPLKIPPSKLVLPAALVAVAASLEANLLMVIQHKQFTWLFLIGLAATVASLVVFVILSMSKDVGVPAKPDAFLNQPLTQEDGATPETPAAASDEKDPLANKLWLNLVEQNVELVDELDEHRDEFQISSRELADHVISRLQEMLERSGVEAISDDSVFDRNRHKPQRGEARTSPGAVIAETLSPGFAVGRRVLRRARVRLVEGSSSEKIFDR